MSKLILNTECRLYEKNGRALSTSIQVAEEFLKDHKNVLRDIENLDCSDEFRRLNFEQSFYSNAQNKKQPIVYMTRDGFTFLAFGYRGKKSAKFKEAYIARFNQMESFIKSLSAARLEFPELTEAIKSAHEVPKHYHFTNEINMINKIVLGKTAKEFRKENGLDDATSIRPYLTFEQITAIEQLQRFDTGLLDIEEDFQKRKEMLTLRFQKLNQRLLKSA
ncbi:hypothetical protein A8709_33080 [Paenibacillus pectinilyticus]|uniref:Uncharacterized protein n=1 Tax=Paenibacillus pectinilyticus TaxID=512399 RepID=A0A1C0ZX24_9BACL|nr:Rha family transcriptional regulator [Paenibacillus pectinilyticus]OCT12646.1 hypothetical protein A8709_33080 [Paenibacillus pectinilyticus]